MKKITITGCSRSATNIEIPNTIEGYPVTKIGYQAFYDCKNIKSVTIPENITYINGNAFYNCIYMKKINWNAKNVVNLNEYPYDNILGECGTAGDGIDIVFGDSVEKIPDYLFNSATISSLPKIKSVTILENVPEIEVNAFSDCPISVTLYTGTESEWKEAYIGIGNDTLTENVIFNVKKKTYHFVTNCENSIPDITDYLVSVSPNVTNIGKRILGWYDNESLSGTPIVFPYYGGQNNTLCCMGRQNRHKL